MRVRIKLKNLIYLTVFFLPTYLVRFSWVSISSNLLEVLMGLTLVLGLLKYSLFFLERDFWRKQKKYMLPLIFLFGGLFFSLFFNANKLRALGIIKAWFILPLLFALMVFQIIQGKEREKIFKVFYFSAVGTAFLGILYAWLDKLTYDGRLQIFFNSPNFLAMYLAPAIIIGIVFFKENKKIYGISLGFLGLAFYLTFSYAAWLAVSVAVIISLLLNKQVAKKWLAIPVLMLTLFLFLQSGTTKLEDFLKKDARSSFSSREIIWTSAGKILADNWLFGIGPGNFQDKYLAYQKYFPTYLEWAVPQPHNLYLAFWLQSGLLGFVGFLWLLFRWLKNIFHRPADNLKWIVLGIMLYILLHGLVDTTYWKNDLAVIFWLTFLAI